MSFDPITAALGIGGKLIDRLFPDPAQRAQAALELAKLEQSGELAQMAGQIEINKIEAASDSFWKSGWRPGIGWVCVVSLFTYYVPYALVAVVIWAWQCIEAQQLLARPDLAIGDLMALVASMLGVGVMRSYDKSKSIGAK